MMIPQAEVQPQVTQQQTSDVEMTPYAAGVQQAADDMLIPPPFPPAALHTDPLTTATAATTESGLMMEPAVGVTSQQQGESSSEAFMLKAKALLSQPPTADGAGAGEMLPHHGNGLTGAGEVTTIGEDGMVPEQTTGTE